MLSKLFKIVRWLFFFGMMACLLPFVWRFAIVQIYGRHTVTPEQVSPSRVAVVFGGGIHGNGQPSDVLRDRLDVAIDLYKTGKVERLLLSGDNSFENYNEPGVMINYARDNGVRFEHIQPDYGGRRTYDSCYRAKHVFGLDEAILVTQEFHMSRALFLCRWMGIDAAGVTSDQQNYVRIRWFQLREVGATAQAALDLVRDNPSPILGQPILID